MLAAAEESASSPVAKKKKKKREFDPNLAIADADHKVRCVTGTDGGHIAEGWGCYRNVVAVPVTRYWSVRPMLTVTRLPIRATSTVRVVHVTSLIFGK